MYVLREARERKKAVREVPVSEIAGPEDVRLLREILDRLEKVLDYLDTNFPRKDDEPAFFARTYTVPAGSVFTLTVTVAPEWLAKIRHLYADVAPNCTYEWSLVGYVIDGNEITFHRAVEVKAGGIIKLTITNKGTADQSIDVLIEGWARRVVK